MANILQTQRRSGTITANAELCQIFAGSSPGIPILGWPAANRCIQPYTFGVAGLGCTGWRDKNELLTVQVAA